MMAEAPRQPAFDPNKHGPLQEPAASPPGPLAPQRPGPPPPASPASIRDPESVGKKIIGRIVHQEYRYATIGLIFGGLVLSAGVVMIFVGVGGAVDLTFDLGDNEIKLKTAVIGVVMAVIGLALIIFTRPNVVIGKKGRKR